MHELAPVARIIGLGLLVRLLAALVRAPWHQVAKAHAGEHNDGAEFGQEHYLAIFFGQFVAHYLKRFIDENTGHPLSKTHYRTNPR